jgi:hypothetical protein
LASFLLFVEAVILGVLFWTTLSYEMMMDWDGFILLSVILSLIIFQFIVINAIYFILMIWKMWSSIKDEETPITSDKAVGFMFIPFFNIYWLFVVWGSFPKYYNDYVDRNQRTISFEHAL